MAPGLSYFYLGGKHYRGGFYGKRYGIFVSFCKISSHYGKLYRHSQTENANRTAKRGKRMKETTKKNKMAKILASCAQGMVKISANTACAYMYHQPKQPESIRQYRKF